MHIFLMYPNVGLDARDIIQIDSTVIAGALILLTITTISKILPEASNRLLITIFAAIVIIPFAISAISVGRGSVPNGIRFMQAGFYFLIISMGYMILLAWTDYELIPFVKMLQGKQIW